MRFRVVDLFAGPGGLAEGFSCFRDADETRVFEVVLSVEKDPVAHRTLLLRSFCRQFDGSHPAGRPFDGRLPDAYYDYVAGRIDRDALERTYRHKWRKAEREALCLTLGTEECNQQLEPVLEGLRAGPDNLVLIGGPPCQAYSLVGRARNKGKADYVASEDHRHFLYLEYIRILDRLSPVAFVMENVKGMLSARVDGQQIFHKVLEDLHGTGQGYEILPLSTGLGGATAALPGLGISGPRQGSACVIRAEEHGVPQARHRVILFGVRKDLAERLSDKDRSDLGLRRKRPVTVDHVLGKMTPLRSGLSGKPDDPESWQAEVLAACTRAIEACRSDGRAELRKVAEELDEVKGRLCTSAPRKRSEATPGPVADGDMADWLLDRRLEALPNHETRGHMASDLARYVFCAVFGKVLERSPIAPDFPEGLGPSHRNWQSAQFADRFKVQLANGPSSTVTSHISKDGNYFIHPDPVQCRSLTVREAARLQTFPDNYKFEGNRTQQFVQVGNAVPPYLAYQIAQVVADALERSSREAYACP
ncbi:MAG: DNA cytosine methyltransferase [Candidatus Sericytochromatia bacterium]|nr:DNA cytosine methyltransferase [Candidatus Sericytochromatia bacterium]